MSIVDEVEKAMAQFPNGTADREELARLQRFLAEAKRAGIAIVRSYDLPLPDTIGRGASQVHGASTPKGPKC